MTHAPAEGPRHPWWWASGIALAAVLLRVALADQRGFWLDEYYTLHASRLPVPAMVLDRLASGHSPLYFLWARIPAAFGESERILRTSSALMIGFAVLCGTGVLRALGQHRALAPFWALSLALPYWFTIGIDYRYMSTLTAVLMGVLWLAVRHSQAPSVGRGLAYLGGVAALVWLHGSAIFPAIAMVLHGIMEARARRDGQAFRRLWPPLLGALCAVPLFVVLGTASEGEGGSRGFPSFDGMLKNLAKTLFGSHQLLGSWLRVDDGIFMAPMLVAMAGAWVLAWRGLGTSDEGRETRRLLASLLGGVPLVLAIYTMAHKDVSGPERYVAAMSAPGILVLAIAWTMPAPEWARRSWRTLLVALVAVQALACAFERGDRNREGIRWLIPQVDPTREIVFVSTNRMNKLAFHHQGFGAMANLWGFEGTSRSDWELRRSVRLGFDGNDRGWIFLYHSRTLKDMPKVLDAFKAEGWLVDYRLWPLGRKVVVGALIRKESERPWLDAIKPPKPAWGPARGDAE
jgi:hypothetical protein